MYDYLELANGKEHNDYLDLSDDSAHTITWSYLMVRHIRLPGIKDTFNMAISHGMDHTITCTWNYFMVRHT